MALNPERDRLMEQEAGKANWKRWGPYLSERAWGTVREDYSADGDAWNYFPHDHARSRAYRWNEDGLGGFCDDRQHLCLAVALWNEKDPILKERMFGFVPEPAGWPAMSGRTAADGLAWASSSPRSAPSQHGAVAGGVTAWVGGAASVRVRDGRRPGAAR